MKKLNRYLFFVFILVLTSTSCFATHIVGGELNYKYISNGRYRITLTVYRDCFNGQAPFDGPVKIGVYNNSNIIIDSILIDLPNPQPVIPSSGDPCRKLPTTGICYEVATYDTIYILNPTVAAALSSGGLQLAYQRCCRNVSIINIPAPADDFGATFYAKIPPTSSTPINSNPTFKNWAPTFICVGYPWIFDHSATDANGDSLVYEIVAPYTGGEVDDQLNPSYPGNKPVISLNTPLLPYVSPYSLSNVFGGIPLSIDSKTGIMTATPNSQGQFVACVRVKEYRKGIYIGETRRDFQVNIEACEKSVVAALTTSTVVCRNKTATFTNQSTGAGSYHWDFGVNGISNDTSISINPSYTYPDTGWYKVRLIAYHPTVPNCTDTNFIDVYIAAKLTADFTFSSTPCIPTINFQDASNKLKNTNNTYQWSFGDGSPINTVQNPTHPYASAGNYNVELIVTSPFLGCKDTIVKPISILLKPPVDAGPNQSVCITKSITIGTSSQPGFNYSWQPSTALDNSFLAQPQASPLVNITYVLTMSNADNTCTAKDTVIVTVNPLPSADAGTDKTVCSLDTANIGSALVGGNTYSWSGANLSSNSISNPKAFPSVNTTYTVTVTNTFACTKSDDVVITAVPLPIADAGPDKDACILSTATPIGSANNPSYNYNWAADPTLSSTSISNPVASPASTKTYFLTVTDPGTTCKNKDQVIVNVLPLPSINAGPDKGVCIGNSIAIGTANNPLYTYSWSPSASLDNAASATPNATPSVNTTYILTSNYTTVTCTKKDTVVVTVRAIPTAFAGSDQFICPGSSTAIGTGPTPNYDYSWTPAAGLDNPNVSSPIANPSVTTTYTLTVFDNVGLCTNTDQVVVNLVQPPAVTGSDVSVCSKDSIVIGGINDPQLIYNWIPSTGLSKTDISNPKASPTSTTTYTLQVVDKDFGCVNQAQVIVNVLALPTAEAGSPVSICQSGQTSIGSADLGFTYSWSPVTGLINPVDNAAPVANPTVSTRYHLTVTSNTSPQCSSKDSVDVTVNPLPSVNAGRDTAICTLLSTRIGENNNPLHTYKWKYDLSLSDSLISNPIASPAGVKTYYLTVTDISTGCKNSDQVTVSVNPLPAANAGNDDTLCTGKSVKIGSANNPLYTYSWSPAANLDNVAISDPTATLTGSQQYFLTVNNQFGCIKKDTVTLTVIAYPVVNAGPDLFTCQGDPVRIGILPNPAYKYKWTPGKFLSDSLSSNPITTSPDSIQYKILATELTGHCSAKDSVFVSVYQPAISMIADPTICAGIGTFIGKPAIAGYTYSWSPGIGLNNPFSSNPFANPADTTLYTLTITDNNNGNCQNSASIKVNVNPLPVFNPAPVVDICIGKDTIIGAINTNPDYTFIWSPSSTLDNATSSNPRANPLSSTPYVVTVTNAITLCSTTKTVNLNVNPLPVINIHPPKEMCEGESRRIGATSDNTYTYSWSPFNTLSSAVDSIPLASPIVNTTYQLTVTNSFGCTDTRSYEVIVALSELAMTDSAKICKFSGITLNPFVNADTFNWTPNIALSPSNAVINPTATPTISTKYYLTVSRGVCTKRDSIFIGVSPAILTADAGPSAFNICKGNPYTLTPKTTGGPQTYRWSTNRLYTDKVNTSSDSIAIVNPIARISKYYLKVSNDYGCLATDSIELQKDSVLISMKGDLVCEDKPGKIVLNNINNNNNLDYQWQEDNDILSYSAQKDTLLIAGAKTSRIFYITVKDLLTNCQVKDSAYVTVSHINGTEAYSDRHVIYEGESTNLKASPADSNLYTYSWTTLENISLPKKYQIAVIPPITTLYSLVITQSSAPFCSASDTALITVKKIYPCGEPDIFVPNAFSPDGNGNNDVLYVRGNSIKTMEFIIFNRWGEKVFEAKDQTEGWDGNYKGKPADAAVYVYYLKATCTGDGSYVKKGNITLLR